MQTDKCRAKDREVKTKAKIKRLEAELKSLKDSRRRGKGVWQECGDGCIDKYAAAIKKTSMVIQKMVLAENAEIDPALFSQIEKLQELSEKIAKSARKETTNNEQGKIVELQKHLESVMTQAKELEKENKDENVKIKKHYNDKLGECNKVMQEQSMELQNIRKKLEGSRQELNKAKVRMCMKVGSNCRASKDNTRSRKKEQEACVIGRKPRKADTVLEGLSAQSKGGGLRNHRNFPPLNTSQRIQECKHVDGVVFRREDQVSARPDKLRHRNGGV
eukprot:TRINITY_DN3719_c0_g1_i13.p1 TRINITY_DN3719_c0_g1~~TRINITY_DN3719_c0_g1_i13.p1  ORF type:complete len:275 (-),score=39.58 TRINITY_DN3719_c0_g1_i13:237-1061(-)